MSRTRANKQEQIKTNFQTTVVQGNMRPSESVVAAEGFGGALPAIAEGIDDCYTRDNISVDTANGGSVSLRKLIQGNLLSNRP